MNINKELPHEIAQLKLLAKAWIEHEEEMVQLREVSAALLKALKQLSSCGICWDMARAAIALAERSEEKA